MSKLLDSLLKWFDTATKDEIDKRWKELEPYNEIGPTVDEYIEYVNKIKNSNETKQS